ncbi:MAG: hypothetical protein COB07_00495 [Sulfurovum sp.]|nr:MAG: hypothetical protein COB07_00495 [Sulfurovum sp.]
MKYFSFLLATVCAVYANAAAPCDIRIESVKNNSDTYTLVLKHDKNCEIIMDHNASHISLVSKDYEKKIDIASVDKSVASSDSK